MIHKLNQVMLYVDNPKSMAQFWVNVMGFVQIKETPYGENTCFIEIAASLDSETTLVLHDRGFVAGMNPNMNTAAPSLMFASKDLPELQAKLRANGVTVGEIINIGIDTFNFADPEGNYFAVCRV